MKIIKIAAMLPAFIVAAGAAQALESLDAYYCNIISNITEQAKFEGAISGYFDGAITQGGAPSTGGITVKTDTAAAPFHLIKNGDGTNEFMVNDAYSGETLNGTVTINLGCLMLYVPDSDAINIKVEVNGGGKLGMASSEQTYLNNLVMDGGCLVVDTGGPIFVNEGLEILDGGMIICVGSAAEGDVVPDFLIWDSLLDIDMSRIFEDAISSGIILIEDADGIQYEIADGYEIDGGTLSLIVGAPIPEASSLAAFLGAAALSFAALRRRASAR